MSKSYFSALLGVALLVLIPAVSHAAGGSVTGKFVGNGQEAKLAYAKAMKGDPWEGKPTTVIVLSEKEMTAGSSPDFDAGFGKFGSALVVTVDSQNDIISTQIYHTAHKKKGFSSVGRMKLEGYKVEGGMVSGKLTTNGEQDFFDDKWLVDLSFQAPMQ